MPLTPAEKKLISQERDTKDWTEEQFESYWKHRARCERVTEAVIRNLNYNVLRDLAEREEDNKDA